jgi:hypothetical protein
LHFWSLMIIFMSCDENKINSILQVIDLKNFKNLLYDSCLVYKKIPDRVLTNSDCYVSIISFEQPNITVYNTMCLFHIKSCEIINRVTVVNDPEETLESYAEFDWPVVYKSRIVANVSAEDVARVSILQLFVAHSNVNFNDR